MAAHTPGPWHASSTHLGAAFDIGAEDGSSVALVHGFLENGAKEFRANARLIAAAPDLLKAAKALLARWPTDQHEGSPLKDEADALRAAVLKAEGSL